MITCKRCGELCQNIEDFNRHRWAFHREEALKQLAKARKGATPGVKKSYLEGKELRAFMQEVGGFNNQPLSDKSAVPLPTKAEVFLPVAQWLACQAAKEIKRAKPSLLRLEAYRDLAVQLKVMMIIPDE